MKTPHPYDLIIGLDRSDRKADLHLIDTRSGRRWSQSVDTAPEALWEWLLQLRQQYPQARMSMLNALDRFCAGNEKALALVRVPTEAQERRRSQTRLRQSLVRDLNLQTAHCRRCS